MTISKQRGAKAKCDRLFSQIVRAHGRCERCSSPNNLQCAHIISRRYSWTRTDEANAFCLCATCHYFFGDHPVEFGKFVEMKIGLMGYGLIQKAALNRTKFDWDAELERLKVRWKEIQ